MNKVQRNEILALGDYETIRPQFRARDHRQRRSARRVRRRRPRRPSSSRTTTPCCCRSRRCCGPSASRARAAIQHEIDTYNELIPGPNELSCTVMLQRRRPGRASTLPRRRSAA